MNRKMKISLTRIAPGLGIALAAVLGGTPLSAHGGHTQSVAVADDTTVTWAIRPSDGQVADGRTAVEFELDPGESAQDYLEVTNLSRFTAEFKITAADGYFTPQGRFNMLPSDRESTDSGTWIVLGAGEVSVDAGESVTVPFTITVPADATPGDHPAGIAASVLSVAEAEDGTTMGVESRVGFRVMTRVTGELSPSITIFGIAAQYASSWDLFHPGAVDVTFVAANSGNTQLRVSSVGRSSSLFSRTDAEHSEPTELFPGDERELSARIADVWPLGFAIVTVELSAAALPEGEGIATVATSADVLVWTVPWLEILIMAGILLLGVAFFWGRRQQAAKVDRLIAEARRSSERVEHEATGSER